MKQQEDCDVCYKIRCKQCGWEACDAEVLQIQKGELTACPVCGWMPGDESTVEEKKKVIKKFLVKQQLAVIATQSTAKTTPESALVAFVEDEELCLYFQTGKYTRKAKNIEQNPQVSLVIGLNEEALATLQYEGIAERLQTKKLIANCKQRFLAKKSPTTAEYLERPDVVFYKVTPTWIRFSDYTQGSHPPVIILKEFSKEK